MVFYTLIGGLMTIKDISFTCYACTFSEGRATIYLFYPEGEWDEDKLSLEEALEAYPITEYNWIKGED